MHMCFEKQCTLGMHFLALVVFNDFSSLAYGPPESCVELCRVNTAYRTEPELSDSQGHI